MSGQDMQRSGEIPSRSGLSRSRRARRQEMLQQQRNVIQAAPAAEAGKIVTPFSR